ncbi:MAG: 5-formyltetrahydrofolate cyclo-ligase [Chakrabartia sp.]
MSSKSALRIFLRKQRQDFVKKRLSNEISYENAALQKVTSLFESGICVAGYCAVGGEAHVTALLSLATQTGCTTALPFIANKDSQIVFRTWSVGETLQQAAFGFQQPLKDSHAITPDIILTPLVGFDRALNRLGQGAGHYDRAFAVWPDALRIGIAWSAQEVVSIPADPWDVPLDAVLTEAEWITATHSRLKAPTSQE